MRLGKEEKTVEFAGEKFAVKRLEDSDMKLARKALEFAAQTMKKKPHLLVLDEINLGVHWNLLEVEDVLELLGKVPKETTVVMTGRYAPQELIERADFVNIVQDVKMPKDFKPTEGIQY